MTNEEARKVTLNAFLGELAELSRKHGWVIRGCGCCGSPYITPLGADEVTPDYTYMCDDRDPTMPDCLKWARDPEGVTSAEQQRI